MEDNKSLKRNALLIAALSSFLTPFMGSSVVISLPAISREFSMDAVSLSWISTCFSFLRCGLSCTPGQGGGHLREKKDFYMGHYSR